MTDSELLASVLGTKSSGDFEDLLLRSAKVSLSLEEIRAQRISFVMGMLPKGSTMTREQVEELLAKHYG